MSQKLNVAICQINPTLGDFEKNIDNISSNYEQALEEGANLVIFPEMAITGYPPQDLLNNQNFVNQNIDYLKKFSKQVTVPCIIGYVDLSLIHI